MKIFYSLFLSLFYLSAIQAMQFVNSNKIVIKEIENNSSSLIELKSEKMSSQFKALKKSKLKRSVILPFVPLIKNLVAYTRDKYYCPKGAMVIKTNFGKYGIWQNETGIICVLKNKKSDENELPKNLFKASNYMATKSENNSSKYINICLMVDPQDGFVVKQIK
ncbi:hypothetical protein M1446_00650 [Candidatus Dependentiae bacterium]|nr:hypothetical protein [Candidatus Dependentiae bacterium]